MKDIPEKLAQMFGQDADIAWCVVHLLERINGLSDGPFRSGFEAAILEIAAWCDGEAGDGLDTMQTIAEKMVGLLSGQYVLKEITPEERQKLFDFVHSSPESERRS